MRMDPATGQATPLGTVPGGVRAGGDGGLVSLAVASTFARDRWVYVLYTTATDNRIVRLRLRGDELDGGSMQSLVVGIPRGKLHNGGRLRFGRDGKLYAALGDAGNPRLAQDQRSLAGKVLRFNPDGTVPSGNPFGGYIWSLGHRNPQGLAFDARGRAWVQESGDGLTDETNLIVKGGNYGWPACEGTEGPAAPTRGTSRRSRPSRRTTAAAVAWCSCATSSTWRVRAVRGSTGRCSTATASSPRCRRCSSAPTASCSRSSPVPAARCGSSAPPPERRERSTRSSCGSPCRPRPEHVTRLCRSRVGDVMRPFRDVFYT
ncbi:PQQ-dependent sugar dehydrogenase [Catellatospora coxensis]